MLTSRLRVQALIVALAVTACGPQLADEGRAPSSSEVSLSDVLSSPSLAAKSPPVETNEAPMSESGPPDPHQLTAQDVADLVTDGTVVDSVHVRELNGPQPAEVVVVGHRPYEVVEPVDSTFDVGAVLVYGWDGERWVQWFDPADSSEALLGDPRGNTSFEAFLGLTAIEFIDFEDDGTVELAIASNFVTLVSGGPMQFGVIDFLLDGSPVESFRHEPDATTGRGGTMRAHGRTAILEVPHTPPPVPACCGIGTEFITIGWDGNTMARLSKSIAKIELLTDGLGLVEFGATREQTIRELSRVLGGEDVYDEVSDSEHECYGVSWEQGRVLWVRFGGPDGPFAGYGTTAPDFGSPTGLRPGIPLAGGVTHLGGVEEGPFPGSLLFTSGPAEGMWFTSGGEGVESVGAGLGLCT